VVGTVYLNEHEVTLGRDDGYSRSRASCVRKGTAASIQSVDVTLSTGRDVLTDVLQPPGARGRNSERAMNTASPRPALALVRFGRFELDVRSEELRRDGERVAIPRQSLQVLALLLERAGELVSRDSRRRRERRLALSPAERSVHGGPARGRGRSRRIAGDPLDARGRRRPHADGNRAHPEEPARRSGTSARRRVRLQVPAVARRRSGSVPAVAARTPRRVERRLTAYRRVDGAGAQGHRNSGHAEEQKGRSNERCGPWPVTFTCTAGGSR